MKLDEVKSINLQDHLKNLTKFDHKRFDNAADATESMLQPLLNEFNTLHIFGLSGNNVTSSLQLIRSNSLSKKQIDNIWDQAGDILEATILRYRELEAQYGDTVNIGNRVQPYLDLVEIAVYIKRQSNISTEQT